MLHFVQRDTRLCCRQVLRGSCQTWTESSFPELGSRRMNETTPTDSLERYVATFTDAERQGLAAAVAAIDIATLLHRAREHRG